MDGIDLCSFMCKLVQFISNSFIIASTFPLHTRHSYIFLHVLFVFRAVSHSYSAINPLVQGISVMN